MAKTSVATQGQIWWVKPEEGLEKRTTNRMKKTRPWMIISPDITNFVSSGYLALPLTHSYSPNDEFRMEIDCPTKPGKEFSKSYVITYKPRLIDEADLVCYIGAVSKDVVDSCIEKLHNWLTGKIENLDGIGFFETEEPSQYIINIGDIIEKDDFAKVEEVINNTVEEETDDLTPMEKEFLKEHDAKFFNKYKHLENSQEVQSFIRLYQKDKKKFASAFSIGYKNASNLSRELNIWYTYLLDRKMRMLV